MKMDYDYVITKPDLNEDTLAHYGVKGMKWRKHKAKTKSAKKNSLLDEIYSDDHPVLDLLEDTRDEIYSNLYKTKPGFRKIYDFMNTPIKDLANANKKVGKVGSALPVAQGNTRTNNPSTGNRPVSRKKNVTTYEDPDKKKTVKKKGSGLSTGKVGR